MSHLFRLLLHFAVHNAPKYLAPVLTNLTLQQFILGKVKTPEDPEVNTNIPKLWVDRAQFVSAFREVGLSAKLLNQLFSVFDSKVQDRVYLNDFCSELLRRRKQRQSVCFGSRQSINNALSALQIS